MAKSLWYQQNFLYAGNLVADITYVFACRDREDHIWLLLSVGFKIFIILKFCFSAERNQTAAVTASVV